MRVRSLETNSVVSSSSVCVLVSDGIYLAPQIMTSTPVGSAFIFSRSVPSCFGLIRLRYSQSYFYNQGSGQERRRLLTGHVVSTAIDPNSRLRGATRLTPPATLVVGHGTRCQT